ncbi:CbtB domain-containing protein [Williamsia phyllosphaerae]|uniref:Cobalt transporter subunit (CbtB) n=1 Tax=Williamsia phyllosphaerae TaxID=885042 RepID=A0ABQ1V1I9_9NOCA|nr:CbtB-domain containing protein [Williamsia phyllosphaerae]GGF31544.1 hypothetical protein GCM10007298_29240 [Williamsia phyllosphaerae]
MSNTSVATASRPGSLVLDTPDISVVNTALWLTATTAVAALAYYFLGYDQGAVSVFGADTHVHEFVHDARHFLGFPCH